MSACVSTVYLHLHNLVNASEFSLE